MSSINIFCYICKLGIGCDNEHCGLIHPSKWIWKANVICPSRPICRELECQFSHQYGPFDHKVKSGIILERTIAERKAIECKAILDATIAQRCAIEIATEDAAKRTYDKCMREVNRTCDHAASLQAVIRLHSPVKNGYFPKRIPVEVDMIAPPRDESEKAERLAVANEAVAASTISLSALANAKKIVEAATVAKHAAIFERCAIEVTALADAEVAALDSMRAAERTEQLKR